jgi:hypothetical protein
MAAGTDTGSVTNEGDNISKSTIETVQGDTTETTYKTETVNRFGKKGQGDGVVIIDNSTNNSGNNSTSNSAASLTTTDLRTDIDSYHDRAAYSFFG